MSEEILSQDTGINVDELDAGTETNEAVMETNSEEPKTNKKSNVAKLLSEKNEALRKVKELESQINGQEFSEEKVNAMIQKAIAETQASQMRNQEKSSFLNTYGEEKLSEVEMLIEQHPTLSYEQAANLAGINIAQTKNPNKFSMAGNTPQSFRQQKTTKDLSDDELLANVKAELGNMGFNTY